MSPATAPAKNYYSYGSALLASEILKDKIEPYCQGNPRITGDLAERKAAVRRIRLRCHPVIRTEQGGELIPARVNEVTELLSARYELKQVSPDEEAESAIQFEFMTIPVTIQFTEA